MNPQMAAEAPMLTVDHHSDGGLDRLRLTGDLDAFGVSRLRQAASVLRKELPLLVDLSAVHFIDGAGVSALVGIVRPNGHRSGNTVVVAGAPVTAALRQTGMDRVVTLAQNSEAAVAWLSSQPLSLAEYAHGESGGGLVPRDHHRRARSGPGCGSTSTCCPAYSKVRGVGS